MLLQRWDKKVKYFKCSQKGHIAINCSVVKNDPATLVVTTEPYKEEADPWVLQLPADGEVTSPSSTTLMYFKRSCVQGYSPSGRNPPRALADFGAQVTLIRCQMLPKLRKNKTAQ